MRFVKSLKNIQILSKKSSLLKELPFSLVIGQVTEKIDATTREVMVLDMKFDSYLKMYFNQSSKFNSVDLNDSSKKGDIVLLNRLKNPPHQTKLFGIEKILYKIDNIVDPITGKSISQEIELINEHLKKIQNKG